jgi:hypothetical protein
MPPFAAQEQEAPEGEFDAGKFARRPNEADQVTRTVIQENVYDARSYETCGSM